MVMEGQHRKWGGAQRPWRSLAQGQSLAHVLPAVREPHSEGATAVVVCMCARTWEGSWWCGGVEVVFGRWRVQESRSMEVAQYWPQSSYILSYTLGCLTAPLVNPTLPPPPLHHPTPLQAGQGPLASGLHLLRMQEAHAGLRAPPAAGEGGRKRLGGAVRKGGRGIGERVITRCR